MWRSIKEQWLTTRWYQITKAVAEYVSKVDHLNMQCSDYNIYIASAANLDIYLKEKIQVSKAIQNA